MGQHTRLFSSSETDTRVTAKMRLYLAIAVLMLALVAYTEAQEETFEQKMAKFTEQVTRTGQELGEKITTGFNDFQNSDFAVGARVKFNEWIDWMKSNSIQLNRSQFPA